MALLPVPVWLSLAAAAVTSGVAVLAWRRRDEPGARYFTFMMAGVALWAGAYAVGLVTFDPALRRAVEVPIEVGKAIVAPAWLLFAMDHTGRGERITRPLLAALLVVPVVTIGLVATAGSHDVLWSAYRIEPTLDAAAVVYDPGPWHYVHAAFGWSAIGLGMALLLETVLGLGRLYRNQGLALIVGAAVPFLTHVKRTFFFGPLPALDLTPIALALTGVLFGTALFRFDLLGLVPASSTLGREAAIDDVGVGVLVLDDDGRVLRCNEAAEPIVGADAAAVEGQTLTAVLPDVDLTESTQYVERRRSDGRRTYAVAVSAVTDRVGRHVGHTVTLTDVTERERRQQRLEVLNRVLRHNLRNEMTVIVGHARTLADRDDETVSGPAATIADRGEALHRLGEKARAVEGLVAEGAGERTAADVASVVTRVAEDAREEADGDVTIQVDVPATEVVTNAAILEAVLENAIENAIRHSDRPEPTVWIRLETTPDGLDLLVEDEGPGIREHEREAIAAGSESALQHASGLGLWVITWGVETLGGEVAFEEREPRGTRVRLSLPAAEPDADDPAGTATDRAGDAAEGTSGLGEDGTDERTSASGGVPDATTD
jgi:PAS domain S-box-containing protein